MKVILARDDREHAVQVEPHGTGFTVRLGDRTLEVEGTVGRSMRVRIDGRPVEASVRRDGLDFLVELRGCAYRFRPRDPRAPKLARRSGNAERLRGELHAPMPGLVVDILVEEGDPVEAGQPVVVVEAMKMQNALTAPIRGRVSAVAATRGASVETGALLLTIVPEEG